MAQSDWIGEKIGGRYEIEELLGQGGMSSVYKGTDPNLRRSVAVKMIHPHLVQDTQFVSRFEEEAAAVARLKHPNIIQVFDFDNDKDTYYMVLEYVSGETLQERLESLAEAGERLDVEQAVKIAASVCDALEYAHNRDMIHRDIKPANIMINEQGQAILTDFGVAKIIGGKQHTATGAVVGTALYISPEQVRGQDPDRRVDIYALGVTLFEMLSGDPPFEADSAMTTMMMHVNEPIPDIRELNHEVPSELVDVIEKALAKDRDQRYSSAAEMARALRTASLTPAARQDMTTVEEPMAEPEETPYKGTVVEEPLPGGLDEPKEPEPTDPKPPGGPPKVPEPAGPEGAEGGRRGLIAGGALIGIIVLCVVLGGGGYLLYSQLDGGVPGVAAATATPEPAPTATPEPTVAPTATVAPPTATAEPTVEPSPTDPTGSYARVNEITVQSGVYIVDYETFGYVENLPGQHVHFFFDTVSEEQAGVPGSGPWYVWGGPRPFNGYSVSDRPAGAEAICARSANPNHSIVPGSGNCLDLPE